MNIIRKSSIGRKLGIGSLLVIALIFSMGSISIYTANQLSSLTEKLYIHTYKLSNAIRNIQIQTLNIELKLDSLIQISEFNDKELDKKTVTTSVNNCELIIKNEFDIIFDSYLGDKKDIDNAYAIFQSWKPIRSTILTAIEEERIDEAKNLIQNTGRAHNEKLYESMNEMMKLADAKAESYFQNIFREKENSQFVLLLFIILSVLITIVATIMIARDIKNPLDKLLYILNEISKGDIDVSLLKKNSDFSKRKDEIGAIYRSFEMIIGCLALPYQDIIRSNQNLKEKTDEIRRLLSSFDKHIIASKTNKMGRITYVSKAFCHVSGYSREELIGKMQNTVRHPDTPEELYKDLWNTIGSQREWRGEIKNKTKDGDYFWISTNISPDIDSEGNTVGYNAISQNITAKKELESLYLTLESRVKEEITKNRLQASYMIQQSRLAQMGEMISMIAHQWRQPLASISAISGTLSIDIVMDNYKKEFFLERLEDISEFAHHLSSTINDFRNFFKEDKEEEEVLVKDLIDSSIQIILPSFSANNITIENSVIDEISLKTYPNEMKQVLINLFKNAEEAIIDKGLENGTIVVQSHIKNKNAHICIEDNAGGISEDIIEKIFDPYFSTKSQKDGTGLGLYMSKMIIQDHCKGILLVRNSQKGAIFEIIIPLMKETT